MHNVASWVEGGFQEHWSGSQEAWGLTDPVLPIIR